MTRVAPGSLPAVAILAIQEIASLTDIRATTERPGSARQRCENCSLSLLNALSAAIRRNARSATGQPV
jgi:hypothetical protein